MKTLDSGTILVTAISDASNLDRRSKSGSVDQSVCLFRNLIGEELPTTRRWARPANTSVYQGSVRGSYWRRSGGGRSRRSTCPRRRRVLGARLLGLQRYRRVVRRATRLK